MIDWFVPKCDSASLSTVSDMQGSFKDLLVRKTHEISQAPFDDAMMLLTYANFDAMRTLKKTIPPRAEQVFAAQEAMLDDSIMGGLWGDVA